MKTFEELLIEVLIERPTDASDKAVRNAAKNYEKMRSMFPFIAAVHDASIEAAQRYSIQNCEAAVICERLSLMEPHLNAPMDIFGKCDYCEKTNSLTKVSDPDHEAAERWACFNCCEEQGFCWNCGVYSAGCSGFDFSPVGPYCDSCQEQIEL